MKKVCPGTSSYLLCLALEKIPKSFQVSLSCVLGIPFMIWSIFFIEKCSLTELHNFCTIHVLKSHSLTGNVSAT